VKFIEAVGVLLIGNSLVLTFWWLANGRQNFGYAIALGLIGIFAGLACILNERITEITVSKVGSIKTAAVQATGDAKAIADIKARIEGQAATVDMVAQRASEAKKLSEDLAKKNDLAEKKLVSIDEELKKASKTVSSLDALAQFTTTVVAAQGDDRKAFDQLEVWAEDKSYVYHDRAVQAWSTIMEDHAKPYSVSYNVPWKEDVDPSKLSMNELAHNYNEAPGPPLKIGIVQYIQSSQDISKSEKLSFYASILEDEKSLTVVEAVGRSFAAVADLKIKPLAIRYFLSWWKENKEKMK